MDEIIVDLDQELVAFKLAEPFDPSRLLVLQSRVIREPINVVLVLIRLTVVLLLHLHLLGLGSCRLRLHSRSLFVESRRFHISIIK